MKSHLQIADLKTICQKLESSDEKEVIEFFKKVRMVVDLRDINVSFGMGDNKDNSGVHD